MSVEDKKMTRELMRALNMRRNLDVTETRISVSRGVGYVGGVIHPAPGEMLDPKVEARAILEACRRIPGLKDVVIDARFDIASKR